MSAEECRLPGARREGVNAPPFEARLASIIAHN